MRIVFLGLPLAAVLLMNDGHHVVLAGVRRHLAVGARRLRRAGVPVVLEPHEDWASFRSIAKQVHADLLVSWFFTRKIPMDLVGTCRLGGIGVHPSLLPRHRGPDPFFAAIDAGDEVTGVTVHRIAEDYDTGAVLAQRSIRLDPSWNAWDLARKLDRPSLDALRETVRRAASGDELVGYEQDESEATEAPQPGYEARELHWALPAATIVRRIRALAPAPGAVTSVGDQCLTIVRATVTDAAPRALEPGEAAVVHGTVIVRAGDGGVELQEVEMDGERLSRAELAMLVARASGK